MVTRRHRFYLDVTQWNKQKTFDNFKLLWQDEFNTSNPFYKLWRIFRNTVNGRYLEIEEEGKRGLW